MKYDVNKFKKSINKQKVLKKMMDPFLLQILFYGNYYDYFILKL